MRCVAIVFLVVSACVAPTCATAVRADDPVDDLPRVVAALLDDLEADRRATRRHAESKLLELGPAVLPHLPVPESLPSAAVREAVRRVQDVLQRRKAEASIQASKVTVTGSVTVGELLATITRQTGNRFDTSRLSKESLAERGDVELNDVPFWTVVDRRLLAFGVVPDGFADDGALRLVAVPDGRPPHALHLGAFRVSVESVRRRRLFGNADEDALRIGLNVIAEPRLRPLFVKSAERELSVTDTRNAVFPPLSPDAVRELPLRHRSASLRYDVRVPAKVPIENVSLDGRVVVTAAAGLERMRFPSLRETRGVSRRRGGVTVSTTNVEYGVEDGKRTARVDAHVVYDVGGPAFESHRTWLLHNDVWLEDESGRRYPIAGPVQTTLASDGGVAVRYEFRGLPESVATLRFVYVAPTLITDVPLEFSWRSIPLSDADR